MSDTIPWNPDAAQRTRFHEQLVAQLLNSLIRGGYIVRSGRDWIINAGSLSASPGGGGAGSPGRDGQDGTRWLTGAGVPDRGVGRSRDLYFDSVGGDVYQKLPASVLAPPVWTWLANLRGGPPGRDGRDGKDGSAGAPGPPGAAGLTGATGAPGAGGDCVLLAAQTLGSDTATVSFTSISGSYSNLQLLITGRENAADSSQNVLLQFNSDTAGNYLYQFVLGNGGSASAGQGLAQTSILVGTFSGASATAGLCGSSRITIPGYAGTTFNKTVLAESFLAQGTGSGNLFTFPVAGLWRSTAAVTRIDLTLSGGASFLTGSKFSLYGMT